MIAKTCQIGELSQASGLTPDTLRYYERIGLLPPPRRTSGGFRVYAPDTLIRLRFIKQAQGLGLTLQEVRDLVSYQDHGGLRRCQSVRDLVRSKLSDLDAKLSQLQEFRKTLANYLEECERTLAARQEAECPVIERLETKL